MRFSAPQCTNCLSRKHALLHFCKDSELKYIDQNKSCSIYKKGQFIFHEGSKPYGVFCVNQGKIKITKESSDGKEQIVRLVKPGDTIGYRALMANTHYSASAVALEDTILCFISKEEFTNLITRNVQIGGELMRLLSTALGEAEERMARMAMKPVRERLAEALLFLKTTYATSQEHFSISISREDLASLVGTAKETAIRFLSEFKEENIITSHGSTITILKEDELLKISCLYD